MEKTLSNIYQARSKLIHEGERLPASIVLGHFRRVPVEAFDEMSKMFPNHQDETYMPIPPLLTFERLVSQSLVNYLIKSQ